MDFNEVITSGAASFTQTGAKTTMEGPFNCRYRARQPQEGKEGSDDTSGPWSRWGIRQVQLIISEGLLSIPDLQLKARIQTKLRHHYGPVRAQVLCIRGRSFDVELKWNQNAPSFIRNEISTWESGCRDAITKAAELSTVASARWREAFRSYVECIMVDQDLLSAAEQSYAPRGTRLLSLYTRPTTPKPFRIPPMNILILAVGTTGNMKNTLI